VTAFDPSTIPLRKKSDEPQTAQKPYATFESSAGEYQRSSVPEMSRSSVGAAVAAMKLPVMR